MPDAKISDTMTAEQAYTAMRNAAACQNTPKGCDLISFDPDVVDFVQLGDTRKNTNSIKTCKRCFYLRCQTITHSPFRPIARRRSKRVLSGTPLWADTKVTMGDVFEIFLAAPLPGYQLPTGGISGNKLMPGGGSDPTAEPVGAVCPHRAGRNKDRQSRAWASSKKAT